MGRTVSRTVMIELQVAGLPEESRTVSVTTLLPTLAQRKVKLSCPATCQLTIEQLSELGVIALFRARAAIRTLPALVTLLNCTVIF